MMMLADDRHRPTGQQLFKFRSSGPRREIEISALLRDALEIAFLHLSSFHYSPMIRALRALLGDEGFSKRVVDVLL